MSQCAVAAAGLVNLLLALDPRSLALVNVRCSRTGASVVPQVPPRGLVPGFLKNKFIFRATNQGSSVTNRPTVCRSGTKEKRKFAFL